MAAVSFEVATGDERSRVSEDRDDLREDHILAFDALEGLDYGFYRTPRAQMCEFVNLFESKAVYTKRGKIRSEIGIE